jgi:hypothetical protein
MMFAQASSITIGEGPNTGIGSSLIMGPLNNGQLSPIVRFIRIVDLM